MQDQSLKIHYRHGKYNFTESELQEMREAIPARIHNEILPKERQIKDLKEQIKTIQAHIDSLSDTNRQDSKKVEDGFEDRRQDCYRLKNYDRRCFEFFAVRDQTLIASTPFEREDHQIGFQFVGDIQEITDPENYTRTLYHDGKLYAFGPRKIFDDAPAETTETATDTPITEIALTDGSEVSPETHHFDPNANDPVLFRNNVRILGIWDHHENEAKTPWETYRADWELTDEEVDAVGEWIRDNAYPNINPKTMKLRRNGLVASEADAQLAKAGKIRDKYIAAHSLTPAEIRDIVDFCDLPF